MARPRKNRAGEHDHDWRPAGTEVLGKVRFRIDTCAVPGCIERRACRVSGIGALPTPSRSKPSPPKRPRCAGGSKAPVRITRDELVYRLATGRDHHVGGRGICSVCGQERSVTRGKVAWHYEADEKSQVSPVA